MWKCVGAESGTKFEADLSEGEWVDYDEKVCACAASYTIL